MPWVFLALSIISAAIVIPLSFVSDPPADREAKRVTNISVKYSYSTEDNAKDMERIVDEANSQIKIVFEAPNDDLQFANFTVFNGALERAIQRGIKVMIITQNNLYKAPNGAQIRYFKSPNNLSFHVNMLLTGTTSYIPSTFVFNSTERTINYRVTVNHEVFYQNAEVIFDYLWDIPYNDNYFVSKWKSFNPPLLNNINISWDPSKFYPINRTNSSYEAEQSLDDSAEKKIISSSGYFPPGKLNYKEAYITAKATRLLEKYHVTDLASTVLVKNEEYFSYPSYFNSIRAAHIGHPKYEMWSCSCKLDGTIIAASDSVVLSPASYHELFRDKAMILGITYKSDSEFDNFVNFWEKNAKVNCNKKP